MTTTRFPTTFKLYPPTRLAQHFCQEFLHNSFLLRRVYFSDILDKDAFISYIIYMVIDVIPLQHTATAAATLRLAPSTGTTRDILTFSFKAEPHLDIEKVTSHAWMWGQELLGQRDLPPGLPALSVVSFLQLHAGWNKC